MAKETRFKNMGKMETLFSLQKDEALKLIALLAGLLADHPAPGFASGACPDFVTDKSKRYTFTIQRDK